MVDCWALYRERGGGEKDCGDQYLFLLLTPSSEDSAPHGTQPGSHQSLCLGTRGALKELADQAVGGGGAPEA